MSVSLTTNQVAVILGVQPETVRRYIRDGKLSALRDLFSCRLGISVAALVQFILEQQPLGQTVFAKNEITEERLKKAARRFALTVVDLARGESSGEAEQDNLFELSWLILSTRFVPEWEGVGKKYRGVILQTAKRARENSLFDGLGAAFQLYELLLKEQEKIPA